MNFNAIQKEIKSVRTAIYEHLEKEIGSLGEEYRTNLESDYNEEKESEEEDFVYDSLEDYLNENADDYIFFAFGTYLTSLITQLSSITTENINSLKSKEREQLFGEYMNFLKTRTGLGSFDTDVL